MSLLVSSADGKVVKPVPKKLDVTIVPRDTWCLIEEQEVEETKGGLVLPVGSDAALRWVVQKIGPEVADKSLPGCEILPHPKCEVLSIPNIAGAKRLFLIREHSIAAVLWRQK